VMRINFYPLIVCYASFVNWDWLLRSAGRLLFRDTLTVVYDGDCKLCRRTIASLRTLDVLGRVRYVNPLDGDARDAPELRQLGADALARDLYALEGGKVHAGFEAYKALAARIPVLWPVLPLLYLWPVPLIARRVYRRVADHRVCEIAAGPKVKAGAFEVADRGRRVRVVAVVGALLLYSYCLFAVVKFNSWPMSMYPTFEDLDPPEVAVITMRVELPSGEVKEITPIRESSQMAPERLMAMLYKVLSVEDAEQRRVRLNAFWKLWVRDNPELRQAVSVRFYKDVISSLPESRNRPPISRELLAELRQDSPDSAAASAR